MQSPAGPQIRDWVADLACERPYSAQRAAAPATAQHFKLFCVAKIFSWAYNCGDVGRVSHLLLQLIACALKSQASLNMAADQPHGLVS